MFHLPNEIINIIYEYDPEKYYNFDRVLDQMFPLKYRVLANWYVPNHVITGMKQKSDDTFQIFLYDMQEPLTITILDEDEVRALLMQYIEAIVLLCDVEFLTRHTGFTFEMIKEMAKKMGKDIFAKVMVRAIKDKEALLDEIGDANEYEDYVSMILDIDVLCTKYKSIVYCMYIHNT